MPCPAPLPLRFHSWFFWLAARGSCGSWSIRHGQSRGGEGKNTHARMVETGGRGTVVRGHPPGRRAPDGGHRERGRDPHARHRQDHHEPDGIGRHDVSKGARQRRIRLPARGRFHAARPSHQRRLRIPDRRHHGEIGRAILVYQPERQFMVDEREAHRQGEALHAARRIRQEQVRMAFDADREHALSDPRTR